MTSAAALRAPASCAEALARVQRHLAPELAGPAARGRLYAAAAALPAELASSLWFECRLAGGAEQVDLSLKVPSAGLRRIARHGLAAAPPPAERVRALARRWLRPGSALGRGASGLWLEHDLPPAAPGGGPLPAPGVFVQLACLPPGAAGADPWTAVAAEGLGALLGGPPGGALLRQLRRCFLALPPGARAVQLGVMLSRGDGSVRLCLAFAEPDALPRYLARVAGAGGAAALAGALRLMEARDPGPPLPRWMLHLDVADGGVLPRLGVDLRLDPRPQLRGGLREAEVLERWTRAGVADPARAAGLRDWPGARRAAGSPAEPPRALVRRVSHLKLVCRPGRAPEAKAYLAFGAVPLPGPRPAHPSPGPRAG